MDRAGREQAEASGRRRIDRYPGRGLGLRRVSSWGKWTRAATCLALLPDPPVPQVVSTSGNETRRRTYECSPRAYVSGTNNVGEHDWWCLRREYLGGRVVHGKIYD